MVLDDPAAPYLIDYVQLHESGARIGITPCPGTGFFPSARERWKSDLAADLDAIAAWGAMAIVSLIQAGEPGAPSLEILRRETESRGWTVECRMPDSRPVGRMSVTGRARFSATGTTCCCIVLVGLAAAV